MRRCLFCCILVKDSIYRKNLNFFVSHYLTFFRILTKNFSQSLPNVKKPVDPQDLPYTSTEKSLQQLIDRRSILESLFRSEGFSWKEVVVEE